MSTYSRARPQMALSDTVLAKWPREVLDEGFCPFPKRLIRAASKLFQGPQAMELLAVVLAVVDHKRPPADRLPSVGYLAYTTGLSPEVFKERLEELIRLGYAEARMFDDAIDVSLFGLNRAILVHSRDVKDAEM